jgi:ATP-dependent DNA helicase RecQ
VSDRIERVARERLGFASLRPGQREAIEAVLAGRDTVAIMSTGSGKTAIYQIAGQLIDGATVVVSPLIALQRDQVDGESDAALLNSTLSEREREEVFDDAGEGELEYVLLAPEQLANEEVLDRLRDARPSLFVVDEAHCVSEWGHDFRPDYLELAEVIERLGRPTVLALTATASPPVRDDIVEVLGLRDPELVIRGFDRPNIWLGVEPFREAEAKRRAVLDAVAAADPPGIVYAATKRATEELAGELRERGVRADAYHGGLSAGRRDAVQEAFMEDDGVDVVVATIAFGMGVDKANVRWVFHHDVSASVDAYYQEVGRAGRDGEPARAVLFYRPEDLGLRRFFAAGTVDRSALERVARLFALAEEPVEPADALGQLAVSKTKLITAVHRLEEVGFLAVSDDGRVRAADGADALDAVDDAVEQAARAEEDRHAFDRSRVEMMRAYAERRACRRAFVLGYFGEAFEPPCGACDMCDAGLGLGEAATEEAAGFRAGERVRHPRWGDGTVGRVEGDLITVVFDSVGYKTLDAGLVAERGLLEAGG